MTIDIVIFIVILVVGIAAVAWDVSDAPKDE